MRRRTPDEEWKDRTDADPDATWQATVGLAPPAPPDGETDDRRRPESDELVASVATDLGVAWSAATLDGWFAEARAAARRARRSPRREVGWTTVHSRRYEIYLTVRAPTAARARRAAEARMPPLPEGWSVKAFVRFEHG